jgi:MYXO-CTERM domain-containing protein
MRYPLLTPIFLGSLLLVGCGQEGPSPGEGERVQEDESPIIGGSIDTTHAAVVAVLAPDFACTGTVLQVTGNIGYVLTAAHCCPANDLPNQVFVGTNYQQANTGVFHNVVAGSVVKDTCYQDYAGSTDDVCMLKFSNAAGVPVIPPMQPQTDNLGIGSPVTYVGYGLTNPPYIPDPNNPGQLIANPNVGNNSKRYKIDRTLSKVDAYFFEYANANTGGTCRGDSGGPALALDSNGVLVVAGVTSFGDQACTQLGSSIRTSAVYTNFIGKYLQDQPTAPVCPAAVDCNACSQSATQNGGCVNITNECFKDAECSALAQCYQGCSSTICITACNNAHVDGLTKYAAILECICVGACPQACGNTSTCTAPKCGLKVTDAACSSCVEATCCTEAWECQSDATCKKCFTTGTPPAACAANAKAAAYYQCAKDQCACAVTDPALAGGTTAASSSAAATGGGEMTTSGAGGDGGGAPDATTVGVGGAAAATATSGAGGGGNSDDVQVGGCACSTAESGPGTATPFAALGLGALGILARRRRRIG